MVKNLNFLEYIFICSFFTPSDQQTDKHQAKWFTETPALVKIVKLLYFFTLS